MTLDLIIYLSVLTVVTGVGIWLYPNLLRPWRGIVILFCLTSAVEIVGHISGMSSENLNLIYQIYTPLSFGLYTLVFRFLFIEKKNKLFSDAMLVLILLVGVGFPFINTLADFPSLSIAICSLGLILESLVMFRELMKSPETTAISRNPRFILSTAILVYWGLFFFRHGLYNSLIREQNGYTIWLDDLHLWFSVAYYITLLICVWMSYKQNKYETPSTS